MLDKSGEKTLHEAASFGGAQILCYAIILLLFLLVAVTPLVFPASIPVQLTITSAPTVLLVSPGNLTNDTDGYVVFRYNASDLSGIANCTIYVDEAVEDTDDSVTSGAISNFTVSGIVEHQLNWSVNCTDNSTSYVEGASDVWYLNVSDRVAPEVYLISPGNATSDADGSVIFQYNVSDTQSGIENCSLYLNGTLNQTNTTVTKDTTQEFTVTGIPESTINWSITCFDNSSYFNSNSSENRTLIINYGAPVVVLLAPPDDSRDADGNITFQYNVTDVDGTIANCTLWADFNGTFAANETDASPNNASVNEFNASGLDFNKNYNWNVRCYDNESNLAEAASNWQAEVRSSWAVFYGDVVGNVTLRTESGARMSLWEQVSGEGNVYIIDTDSAVSWTGLQALGRNTTGQQSSSDFTEVDSALGLSGFSDNITTRYSTDGSVPKSTASIDIFGITINYVPLDVSLNSTNFTTGILWDTTDTGADAEFDSTTKEDLVWVVRVNESVMGSIAVSDYEIKVPDGFHSCKSGTDSISFYLEII